MAVAANNGFKLASLDIRAAFLQSKTLDWDRYKSRIYPSDLELNKENTGFKSASVQEMKINIIGEEFNVSVYDKRDSFGFEVFRYPSIHSNTLFFVIRTSKNQ